MTRILVANSANDDLVGAHGRNPARSWAQRVLWFARDGDVIVLPAPPDHDFAGYVTALTGVAADTLRFVVPPPGYEGDYRLTADRLADPALHAAVREAVAGRRIERVWSLWPDASVAGLATALDAGSALPGAGFLAQGGGTLVNSKAVFRAIAVGAGVPVPEGWVCTGPATAEDAITRLLARGEPVMLKQEYLSGGDGNEIISPTDGVPAVGAHWTVVLNGPQAVRAYLRRRWDWLSRGGRHHVVVERYHPGSTAVFAEFELTDDGVEFGGHGEMVSAPVADSELIPPVGVEPARLAEITAGGRRLCQAVHTLGYRGTLSADAIVTGAGGVLFTEYNGRTTGSTHVYRVVGQRLVGADYADHRLIRERVGWWIPAVRPTVDRLVEHGLAFDPRTRTGVVLLSPPEPSGGPVQYCVVAESLAGVMERQHALDALFADPPAARAAARAGAAAGARAGARMGAGAAKGSGAC